MEKWVDFIGERSWHYKWWLLLTITIEVAAVSGCVSAMLNAGENSASLAAEGNRWYLGGTRSGDLLSQILIREEDAVDWYQKKKNLCNSTGFAC
jgi:hypothetical protein